MDHFTIRTTLPQDYAPTADLIARVFSRGDPQLYERLMHYWIFTAPRSPQFDHQQHRIGVLTQREQAQIVAHLLVRPYTLRYGSVLLRVAGISAVCTEPAMQGRGYASALMHDALTVIAEQGAHLVLLHSAVEQFYERFGFGVVFPHYLIEIDAALAAQQPDQPFTLRAAAVEDGPALAALYERHWSGRVALVRSPELWRHRLNDDSWRCEVLLDGQGQIQGYLAARPGVTERTEAVADTPDAALSLLALAGRRCLDEKLPTIRWLMPPDDAIITAARSALPVRVSASYTPSGGWMARVIDPQGLIATLLPEITTQATLMWRDFDAAALRIETQPDTVRIQMGSTVCALRYEDFMPVMFGSLRPAALAQRDGLAVEVVWLLEALFPPRMAALAVWDWF